MAGGHPVAVGHDPGHGDDFHPARARAILRRYGFDVDPTGGRTDRLLSAWRAYRRAVTGGSAKPREIGSQWTQANPRTRNTGKGGKPVVGGSASEMVSPGVRPSRNRRDFVDATQRAVQKATQKAGHKTDTHARAKAHSDNLGVKGHGGAGAGVPGLPGGGTDVNKLLPQSYADKIAGLQFDPAISEARLQIGEHGRDSEQAQRNISDWFGQVQKSQATAGTRDAEAGTRARGDVSSAIQGILQSLGGSRGAGVVGAAGANDLTELAGQGASQDRYNADVAPILANEQAGAASRQKAISSQADTKLQQALIDLQGQRGSAKAQALMQIIQSNNAARQSNFGNRVALQNAALAASSLGLDAARTQATLQQYATRNSIDQQKLDQGRAAAKAAAGHPNWATLNPIDRQTLIDNAIKTAAGQHPGVWDPDAITNSALETIRAGSYGSARKLGYKGRVPNRANQKSILGLLSQRLAYYHGQNPQQ